MAHKVFAYISLALSLTAGVHADIVTRELSNVYSGGTPEGAAPWITSSIDDGGTAGSVTMTIADTGLVGSEHMNEFYFNLDPTIDASSLTYNVVFSTADDPSISAGTDAYTASGGGAYDVVLGFTNSNSGGGQFGVGDIVVIEISGGGIAAGSFDYVCGALGGSGPYYASAHIGLIGDEGDSAWISDGGEEPPSVPEPATILLALLGGGAAAGARRRRMKLQAEGQK